MEKIIKEQLSEIEVKHNVRILFACESGSRAWGFPSPDSDYDVRFIYAHPIDWYLSINEKQDVIELPVNEVLDINGWDLRKAMRLLVKGNAVLGEWIQSPIVYLKDDAFAEGFKEAVWSCFSPIAAMHHYLNMAKKHYEECMASSEVKLKKYLYCLRSTLACNWIAESKDVPPMELEKLMLTLQNAELAAIIKELVELKATKEESYLHPHIAMLDDYLKGRISASEGISPSLPASKADHEQLNILFRKTVR